MLTRMRACSASPRRLLSYLRYLRDAKKQVWIAILAGILYGISSGFGIPIILEFSSRNLFGDAQIPGSMLVLLTLLPAFVMFIRGISGFLSSYYFAACGQRIVEGLRLAIFQKIQRLHLGFFNDYPPAEVISRSIDASTMIQTGIVNIAEDIVTQPMVLLGATGYLAYLCIQQQDLIALLLFLSALPAFIFPIRRIGLRLRRKSEQMQGRVANVIDKLNHNLAAIKEVRAFGLENAETERYRMACRNFANAYLKVIKYQLFVSPMVEILSAVGVGFTMFYAYQKGLSLEVFMSLATALYFGYDALKRLGVITSEIQTSMGAVDRIESILGEPEQIRDPKHPVPLRHCRGEIQFSDVTFSYGTKKPALKNIGMVLHPGRKYALVGSSGAGKSTFVNMILRFYDPQQGTVALDGIDLRSLRQKDLRSQIGYVPQDPALINDTVLNNILWGNPKASREEVVQAARAAYAHDFIAQLPEGYDTIVGEGGSCLSGGQRQRIALARVFLKNSKILIFDEATSALDAESQHAIYQAVEAIASDRTVIMISHRFSMMSMIDEALVFDHGAIVERGTHHELLSRETLYKKLYEKQQVKNEHS